MEPFKLRTLLAFQAIIRQGTVNKAAAALHLSQPTLTRAIKNLEQELGVDLFYRRTSGMEPTEYGGILAQRLERSLEQLALLEQEVVAYQTAQGKAQITRQLHKKISLQQLDHLSMVERCNDIHGAAQRAGITIIALLRSTRNLEKLIGGTLFTHHGQTARLTTLGEIVLRRAKLALVELESAREEISHHRGTVSGRLRVGALPLSRTSLVPNSVLKLLEQFPHAEVSIIDGNYENILPKLLCGDIDIIVGALRRPAPAGDVREETLFMDNLVILAGANHPLATRKQVPSFTEIMDYGWALPPDSAPTRRIFNAFIKSQRLKPPTRIIEVSSLVAIRALLTRSDFLTILSLHQTAYEIHQGILKPLEVKIADAARAIGMTTRTDHAPTPIVRQFITILRETVASETRRTENHLEAG